MGALGDEIQDCRGWVRERSWEEEERRGESREFVRGGMSVFCGWSSRSFLEGKSCKRREGTPAWRVKECWIWACRMFGSGDVLGRMRRMSQLFDGFSFTLEG